MDKIERKMREKQQVESRRQSRSELIKHILELSVGKILEASGGQSPTNRQIGEVLSPIMSAYRNSDPTLRLLGIRDYQDWDDFFGEVEISLRKKIREEISAEKAPDKKPHINNQIKQKQPDLF